MSESRTGVRLAPGDRGAELGESRRAGVVALGAALSAAAALGLGACGASVAGRSEDLRGVRRAEASVAAPARGDAGSAGSALAERSPVIYLDSPLSWEELRPALAEAAGAQVLEEALLDRLVARELRDAGLSVSAADASREERELLVSVQRAAGVDEARATAMLAEFRRARGLGPVRYRALLERNAGLRALVAGAATVAESDVDLALRVRHGVRHRVRLLVLPTERAAAEARAALGSGSGAGGGVGIEARFAERALRESIDATASAGGLVEAMSPEDPAYPAGVRAVLAGLRPGDMSPVVALDEGAAVVLLVGTTPADQGALSNPALRERARAELLTRTQRVAMDELATRLLAQANPTVLDRSLGWAWETRARPGAR